MKKKRSTRLINAGDILLTIICLIGMAVALYLFWEDLNVTLAKQDEAPIAVVYFKQNTVQRRFVDRNLWERVQESALVYEGDRIRTSEMSEAVTVFADGTEIEIHENTLIQIYTQKNRAAVDFVSGAITATAAGFEGEESESAPLLIKTGDKVVELDSGSAASVAAPVSSAAVKAAALDTETAKPQAVAVTVTKGSAAVREARVDDHYKEQTAASSVVNAAQNSITDLGTAARQVITNVSAAAGPAEAEETLVAEKQVIRTGEVSVVKTVEPEVAEESAPAPAEKSATLYLPLSSTTVRLEEGSMPLIMAQWESNTDLTFEFARDASFNKPLFTRTYPSYQAQAYISLNEYAEPGSIFWRAYFAGEPDSIFAMGVVLIQEPPSESVQEMIDRVLNDETQVPLKEEPDTQEEAIKAEAIRKEEEERRAREEAARLDAERARRQEEERLAAIKAAEEQRLAAEKAEAERIAAEKAAAEKAEQDRLEAEREAAERALTERRLAAARAAEEKRLAAERAAAEKAAAEKAATEKKLAAERKAAADRAAAEKAAAEKAAAEKAAAEKRLQEEIEAAQRAAEEKRIAAARAAEEQRIAAERRAEARALAEKKAAEEAAAKAEAERIAAEKAAAKRAFIASSPSLGEPRGSKVLDDDFFSSNSSLTFSWSTLPNAASYELIIKQKGIFSKTILDRNVLTTQYTLRSLSDLDEGEFEWMVIAKMADGTQSTAASRTFSVKLEPLEDIQLDFSDLFHR